MHRRTMAFILAATLALLAAWSGAALADESGASNSVSSASSPADRLEPLEWLLGEWTGMTDNAVVLVSAHWCEGGGVHRT